MTDFKKYFATYEATEPPPIQTEGYAKVKKNYEELIIPSITSTSSKKSINELMEELPEVSLEVQTEPPTQFTPIKFSPIQQNSSKTTDVVNLARQFVGTKYSWGGSTPSTGFDCSGLVQYAYKQNGINLPRTVKEIEKVGTEVSLNNVQRGDLICSNSSGPSGKHVRMVSDIRDGQIYTIDARGKRRGIVEEPLTNTSNITTVRRVIGNNTNNVPGNYIVQYFTQKGLTLNQAKGIYGNLMQESRGNLQAVSSDGNDSYGLAQWTGSRKRTLFSMYGSNPTAYQQLDFLWWELNNTHKGALAKLRDTTTVADATRVFMNEFERPHKDYANFNKRLQYANSV